MSGLLLTCVHPEVLFSQGVKGLQQLGCAAVVACPQPREGRLIAGATHDSHHIAVLPAEHTQDWETLYMSQN